MSDGAGFAPARGANGYLVSAGTPKNTKGPSALATGQNIGLLVRGVVITRHQDPNGHVFCDVLTYSNIQGGISASVARECRVLNANSGLHKSTPAYPKPSYTNISRGSFPDLNHADPSDLNGDHVLVGFMDQSLRGGVILGCLPHPRQNHGIKGNPMPHAGLYPGEKEKATTVFKGIEMGPDGDGNIKLDAKYGSAREMSQRGFPPRLPGQDARPDDPEDPIAKKDGTEGNIVCRLREGSRVQITIEKDHDDEEPMVVSIEYDSVTMSRKDENGDETKILTLTGTGNETTLVLGDEVISGSNVIQAVIGPALKSYIADEIRAVFNGHTHRYTDTGATPPTQTTQGPMQGDVPASMGDWSDTLVLSNKLKFPDNT